MPCCKKNKEDAAQKPAAPKTKVAPKLTKAPAAPKAQVQKKLK